ncbi:hypothetical protein BDR03DRAFT_304670 [Suillus americanus]|nr:hypothetical protein BDR03DRAFT_304670 [Suillus americanus]
MPRRPMVANGRSFEFMVKAAGGPWHCKALEMGHKRLESPPAVDMLTCTHSTEEVHNINEVEVLEGNTFDFDELDRVEQVIIPRAILDEVQVVN